MDIAGDLMSIGSGNPSGMLLATIGFLCLGLVMVIFYMYILNQRYPKVQFHVIEQGMEKRITQRLMGDKVVPSSLINILLKGDTMLGEDINTFPYLQSKGGKRVYYAYMRNMVLVPCEINEKSIDVGEINKAREIAYRYINMIKMTKDQTSKNEPLIMTLIAIAPWAVMAIIYGFMIYILITGTTDSLATSIETLAGITSTLKP